MEALVKVINRIFLRKQKPFDRTQKANSISVGRKRGGGGGGITVPFTFSHSKRISQITH